MAGTYKNIQALVNEADNLFGCDIGFLVENLFLLAANLDEPRIVLHLDGIKGMTDVEKWILANVGLPQYVAPHLEIQLRVLSEKGSFVVAELSESSHVLLLGDGRIVWQRDSVIFYLNSNCLALPKTTALYGCVINQAMLVGNSNVVIENRIPAFLKSSFIDSISTFDPDACDAWLQLTKEHWDAG